MNGQSMQRREFITLLGGGAAAWPLAAGAQQPKVPVIGYLHFGARDDGHGQIASFHIASFHRGLREAGFIEGQNVAVEYRFAENRDERAQALAAELVRQQVALIVAAPSQRAIGAAKAATTTIPIVFMSGPDPVREGLVASLNRPGGNLTGVTQLSADLTTKRLGLLHDLAPHATSVAVLFGQGAAQAYQLEAAQMAGRAIGLRVFGVQAGDPSEFDAAFASAAREGAGALLVATNLIFVDNRERLATLAASYKLPAMYQASEFVAAGGLMSYGPSTAELFRQVGRYAGRILKGDKPGDLPVMLPTQFEFIINLKTTKTLGLDIPPGVLALADAVIE
jgi:putative ABC transport system substrate-binding protein